MNLRTPSLKPEESILSLTPGDECLHRGHETVSLPPQSLEEAHWLTCYLVKQSIYAGTHILKHLFDNPPGNSSHLVPLLLYRHALDIGDSIGTLLRFGATTTASALTRSLFETSLGLGFILQDNEFHEDRASCYQAFNKIRNLNVYTRYDPATSQGAELHGILERDPRLKVSDFTVRDFSKERKTIEEVLQSDRLKPFWDKYRAAKRKPKNWYSLCSNASGLRDLSKLIGREAEYILLYNMLSEVVHASDVMSGVLRRNEKRALEVDHLRGPAEKVNQAASLTANYLMSCHNSVLETYLKNHEKQRWFFQWYKESYRPFFLWAIDPGRFSPPS